ncbi:hypothetical protein BBO99_00007912 [Phytophthora kernoviae]|uniref:protein O-GlcNAc transferase n=2 Tax=Phytophthora kernoviae TaxID=325452 RepID=A0A421GGH5_9STRA|nr:hypothetical protein G195_005496 [Phytophthora kernoviae 00238/432]KAG2517138.1 hypothetical protein JM16_007527 [Phytophthora kernoviae]KAG2519649.1 hypothetical protein JM18_007485 [Phytophthora kernoviae]RLN31914.1 hypothetical protein BBI17_007865 [Phytophthora kernoviae]RLN75989.1 hypothetical protein BBO99_00007912 [Phytophthora kernoviae]
MNKYRVLCLHGYRQDALKLRGRIAALRRTFKSSVEFVCLDAPFEVPYEPTTEEHANTGETGENVKQLKWCDFKRDNETGEFLLERVEESLEYIASFVKTEGPFDGIFGFSQGGSMASMIMQRQVSSTESPFAFRFAIFVSAGAIGDPKYTSDQKVDLPSLHIIGETDAVVGNDRSRILMDIFVNPTLLMHPGGHYIPTNKEPKDAFRAFFKELPAELYKAAQQTDQVTDKMRLFQESINAYPDLAAAYNNLAMLLFDRQDKEQAVQLLERGLQAAEATNDVDNIANIHNNFGFIVRSHGKLSVSHALEAIRHFDLALQAVPDCIDALYNKASALLALRHDREAQELFLKVLEQDPNKLQAHLDLGRIYFEQGNLKKALMHENRAIAGAPTIEQKLVGMHNKGVFLKEHGFLIEAVKVYDEMLAVNPRSAYILVHAMTCKRLLCDWKDMEALENRAFTAVLPELDHDVRRKNVSFLPYDSTLVKLSGVFRKRLASAASEIYEQPSTLELLPSPWRENDPSWDRPSTPQRMKIGYLSFDFRDHPMGHLTLGLVEQHAALASGVDTYCYSYGSSNTASSVYWRRQFEEKCSVFRDLVGLSDLEAAQTIGLDGIDVLVDLMAHTKGARLADVFLDSFIYNAHSTAADALWASVPIVTFWGDTFPSRVAASLVLNAMPFPELVSYSVKDYEQIAIYLATAPKAGQFERAVEYITQAVDASPDVSWYHSNLGVAYLALDNLQLAEREFQVALQLDATNLLAISKLTSIYITLKAFGKVIDVYSTFGESAYFHVDSTDSGQHVSPSPEQIEGAYLEYSDALTETGQSLKAIQQLQTAIPRHPTLFRLSYNLAVLLNGQGRYDEGNEQQITTVVAEGRYRYEKDGKHFTKIPRPDYKMVIAIYCHEYGQAWWEPWGPSSLNSGLGGSEEAVVFLSRELQKLGYWVEVYGDPSPEDLSTPDQADDDTVRWYPLYTYDIDDAGVDIFVAWRYHISLAMGKAARKKYLWMHDVPSEDAKRSPELLDHADGIFCVSEYQRSKFPENLQPKITVSSNALDPSFFKNGPNHADRFVYGTEDSEWYELWIRGIIDAVHDEQQTLTLRHRMKRFARKKYRWEHIALQWHRVISKPRFP